MPDIYAFYVEDFAGEWNAPAKAALAFLILAGAVFLARTRLPLAWITASTLIIAPLPFCIIPFPQRQVARYFCIDYVLLLLLAGLGGVYALRYLWERRKQGKLAQAAPYAAALVMAALLAPSIGTALAKHTEGRLFGRRDYGGLMRYIEPRFAAGDVIVSAIPEDAPFTPYRQVEFPCSFYAARLFPNPEPYYRARRYDPATTPEKLADILRDNPYSNLWVLGVDNWPAGPDFYKALEQYGATDVRHFFSLQLWSIPAQTPDPSKWTGSILINGDIEEAWDSGDMPPGWRRILSQDFIVAREEESRHGGAQSMMILGREDKDVHVAVASTLDQSALRGRDMVFTAWVRTTEPASTYIQIIDGWKTYHSVMAVHPNTWERITASAHISPESASTVFDITLKKHSPPVACIVDDARAVCSRP